MSNATERVLRRARASAIEDGDCLLVTAYRPQPHGYVRSGRVDDRRSGQLLHRLVMEEVLGRQLEPKETVDHLCHNADTACPGGHSCKHRRCINPGHLSITTAVENWRGGRQGAPAERLAKTHCPIGHPYEDGNLRANKHGWRGCKACHRARAAGRDPAVEPTYL